MKKLLQVLGSFNAKTRPIDSKSLKSCDPIRRLRTHRGGNKSGSLTTRVSSRWPAGHHDWLKAQILGESNDLQTAL